MKLFAFFVGLLLCATFSSNAQKNGSVTGILYDTSIAKPISDVTVTLMAAKDSSLVSFSMSSSSGYFEIGEIKPGSYLLLFTHISYHNKSHKVTISDTAKKIDMGRVIMNDRSKMLSEVVVTNQAPPVTLIGDTVQYNAGSFKTAPNASVEQLLKQLPGVQVDKDGNVKAQGEKVSKVLVDGKEFFGNDPKMATKNLPADAVDKVQVYNKQSEQAALTGFDDGNYEKTINLKLKEDKKKGSFGKISAGAGTGDRWEGRGNVNSFRGARQMSVIGLGNNTNAEGFSMMDMMNFTGDLNRALQSGGGVITMSGSPGSGVQGMGGSGNEGFRTLWGGGINYNNLVGKKSELTSNYFHNGLRPMADREVFREYILPDSSYFYKGNTNTRSNRNSHALNLGLDLYIDSFHSIRYKPSVSLQNNSRNNQNQFSQFDGAGFVSNQGYSNTFSESDARNWTNDLLFRKKFKRKGRTLSLQLNSLYYDSKEKGGQESVNEFWSKSGGLVKTDSVLQRYNKVSENTMYSGRLVYTEPVFSNSIMEFNAGGSISNSNSIKNSFDQDILTGKFDQKNDSLSNDFESNYSFSYAGFKFRSVYNRWNYSIGFNWQRASLDGKVLSGVIDTKVEKAFYNILPDARAQYKFSRNKTLSLSYSTRTQQPGISQLQPVPDISNPLFIVGGNPELNQEYNHNLRLQFMSINPIKNKNLFAFLTLTRTDDKIISSDSLFSNGVRKSVPVNADGIYSLISDISYSIPTRFIKGTFEVSTNFMYNTNKQFMNGLPNNISNMLVGPRIRYIMSATDKLDITLGASANLQYAKYSLQKDRNTRFFSQDYDVEVNWTLPKGFHFQTELSYVVNNQFASGFNTKVPLWGASVRKQILAGNRGEIRLSINDILNRNLGVTRNANQSYIEDTRINNLRRFALLSFTYSLSKVGAQSGAGATRIIMR